MKSHRFRLWPILIVFIVSLACTLPGIPFLSPAATPTATPQPLPPTIVETVPQMGSELALKGTLIVYFSTPMDKTSVEAALTSNFTGGFMFNWLDDTILAVTPKTPFPTDAQVDFTLATTAKAANGLAPLESLTFSYKTAGLLRVSQVLPAPGAKDVSPDSVIVVTFNQPVVALGADNASLPAGLGLTPAVQGKGEWLNTSTYAFHPEPALAGGVDYTVQVNSQLAGTSGTTLDASAQNNAWTFHTSLPALLEVSPKDSDGALALDPALQFSFNQPMDRASVEASLALTGPKGKVPGSFEWNDKSSVVTFKPSILLERETMYTLNLSGQAHSPSGATLGNDVTFTYQTVSPFGAWYTAFPSGSTRPIDKNVAITFTALPAKYTDNELEKLITISPKVAYNGYYVDGQTININGLFDPGKTYTVTFSKDLRDHWGQPLGQDYVFTFRQPDAQPSLMLAAQYLPMVFIEPTDPVVDIEAINVNTVHVQVGAFYFSDFFRYMSDFNYRRGYSPVALDNWDENPGLPRNDNEVYSLKLQHQNQPFAPGIYYLGVSSNELAANSSGISVPMLVSNINVTLKTSGKAVFVWAMDLRTQTPVADAAVTFYDSTGNALTNGRTDANGLWQGELPAAPKDQLYAVISQPGDDLFGMSMADWNQEISPWNFGFSWGGGVPSKNVYLYTERPIYRPGDVVHYRGVVRQAYNGRYSDAGLGSLSASLMASGSTLSEAQVQVSAYGTFHGEFTLPAGAVPGGYSINVSTGDQGSDTGIYFDVADYRKPEINLSVTVSPSPALSGQTLTGKVAASYFFGAPVPDLPFEWHLYKNLSHFDIPEYSTGLYHTSWYSSDQGAFGGQVADGKGRTGADGTFNIPLENIKVDDTSEMVLEITASETGGLGVSARQNFSMHPANFYIGIRPDAWFGQAGKELGFGIKTVDWDQKAVSGKALNASFQKVTWERGEDAYGYSFTPTYTPVESKSITVDADGKAHAGFTPAEAGTYMLEVSGEAAKSQVLIWVGGKQNAAWPNLPYQHLELTADKAQYQPGDTAGVFVPNPFGAPAPALVTTERSSVLTSQVINIPAEGYTFSLPLSDDQAPNTYLSVTLLGPNTEFRQGYVNLKVTPSAFKLNVDLKATPEKAKPGDKVTVDLSVTDSKGQPVQGEFSMAAVDLAVLALADPNSQDIVPAYYDIQPLGVSTSLTDAVSSRLAVPDVGGKGGGGGDGETLTLREKFPDTAYWQADIVTDAQGKAQISFTLPDSLTTWQVESRGLTKDTKVGQARVRVVTSKDLLIRPQTPRFLVVGDHVELAAIVNNTTSSALDASVSLQANGFSLDDPATAEQKVNVPAGGRVRVAWSGLVQAGDAVDAIFSVKAGNLQDASRPNDGPIPVLHYTAPQTFSTAGILADAAARQEIIGVPKSFQPLGGKLDIELSPSLAAVILSSLQAQKSGPDELNWSNELIASDFLSNLVTYQTLKDSGLSDPTLATTLATSVRDDVHHLLANQNSTDNGWAWTTEYSAPSDPYLTAYILFALNQVSKTDLQIDVSSALQRGHDYLMAAPPLDGQSDLTQAWALNRAVFMEYVLQQTGGANQAYINTIYASRDQLDPWAKTLLAETLLGISPTDARGSELISSLQTGAIRSATGAHWESAANDWRNPGSPLFSTAVVVYSLAQHDAANPLLADAVRYLAAQRGATSFWGSPYETTWVILALNQYMKATGELQGNFNFSAALNGTSIVKGNAAGPQNLVPVTASAPLTQMYLNAANSLLVSRDAGPGKLYYRAALTVDQPVEKVQPVSRGIDVSRQFLACNGKDCQPVTSYQMLPDASGRVKVQLTVTLPNDAYYVMVQDFIPAGADILDSSLKTSQQGQQNESVQVQYDNADPFSEGWGWWYFNAPKIYSDHILWSADYLPAGTYVLTYTIIPSLPGQYHVLPAHAWQAYFPEVQGTSAGTMFEILSSK